MTTPPARNSRSRVRRLALAGALVLLLIALGIAVPGQLRRGEISVPTSSPSASPSPRPQDELNAPGYELTPEPLKLPDISRSRAEPVTATFTLPDEAVRIDGSFGLSFEATDLASPVWNSPDSNLDEVLAALDRPVLRFGGNSVDRRMWWTSRSEPAPEWAQATVTPEDLDRVAAAAEQADATVTITLDLGHNDPARAADMAAHAREAFGERLLAVSIGNEPNGFFHENQPELAVRDASWSPEAYQRSLRTYSAAIEDAAPGIPVAGPGAYDAPWWRAFAESGIPHQEALTMHWYPLWDCTGPDSSIANPTVQDLTSPVLRERERQIIGMGMEIAEMHGMPLWMEETGPTSCPGTNETSRTHAQALWTVDHSLIAAEAGVQRMAFHSTLQACEGGAPMSPICATGPLTEPGELLRGRTSFLALMQLAQLPDGRILAASPSGDDRVAVHAVLGDDGSLAVMIVDMRDPQAAFSAPIELSAPNGLGDSPPAAWRLVDGSRLEAESLFSATSSLGAPAPIDRDVAPAELRPAAPLTVGSRPGSVTLLRFAPADAAAGSDAGGASDLVAHRREAAHHGVITAAVNGRCRRREPR